MQRPWTSLRIQLLLLVLLAGLPAIGLLIVTGKEMQGHARHMAREGALQWSRIIIHEHNNLIEMARQLLATLSQLPALLSEDPSACGADMAEVLAENRLYLNIGALNLDGDLYCSALPFDGPVNAADRLYFQRALQSKDFSVGEFQIGRVTQQPSLNFGYPVVDEAGDVRAVVFAALGLNWLNEFAAKARLPEGTTLTLIDRDGVVLARHPDPERWVGASAAEMPLVNTLTAHGGQGTAETTGLDGVVRLYAFEQLQTSAGALYLGIGVPIEQIVAEAGQAAMRNIALSISLVGLALILAWVGEEALVLRKVRAVSHAIKRLEAGDLSARSGVLKGRGELEQLAHGFDQMAASLQQRTAESRQRVEQLAGVSELGRALSETLDLPQVFERLSQGVHQLLPSISALFISRYDAEKQLITCAYGVHEGKPIEVSQLPPIALEPPGHGPQSEVIHTRQPLIVNDFQARLKRTLTNVSVGDPLPQSALYAPMLSKERVIGVIQVQSYALGCFKPSDAELLSVAANTAAVTIENADLFAQTQRRMSYLQSLRQIDMAITASVDLRVVLNVFLDQVIAQLRVDAAALLLYDSVTNALEYAAGRGFRSNLIAHSRLRPGEGFAGRAVAERRARHIADLKTTEDLHHARLFEEEQFEGYSCVPLMAKGQIQGALEVFHRAPLHVDQDWLHFLEALAGQAAIAIDNAGLFEKLQRSNAELAASYDATLEGWAKGLELREKETEGHTQRVAEIFVRLAQSMGMRQDQLVHHRRGALLHDIGKIGIPDSILLKPGPLSDAEWHVMRQHPVYAQKWLQAIPFLQAALEIPYCHHERWDGSGYPRGLKGEEIPLSARIFAVVDAWDALRSDRPYRAAWPEPKVRQHLREQAGKQFDPNVVAKFLMLLQGEGLP